MGVEPAQFYDVAIIGGGPAGIAAGVYAARKELKTIFITFDFNNQSVVSSDIENWVGEPHITGTDLMQKLETHLRQYEQFIRIQTGEKVTEVKSTPSTEGRVCDFEISTDKGSVFKAKSVIV